jgi:hypothetical protein
MVRTYGGTGTRQASLRDYLEGACVPAVLAVLCGVLANDVIKLVSKKGALGSIACSATVCWTTQGGSSCNYMSLPAIGCIGGFGKIFI